MLTKHIFNTDPQETVSQLISPNGFRARLPPRGEVSDKIVAEVTDITTNFPELNLGWHGQ